MSGETKHTPGPWHTDPGGVGCEYSIENQNQGYGAYTIAEIPDYLESDYPREIIQANARLIAAAPDLLEALEAVLEELRGDAETIEGEFGTYSPQPTFADMIQKGEYPGAAKAIKAIAKAKGETA